VVGIVGPLWDTGVVIDAGGPPVEQASWLLEDLDPQQRAAVTAPRGPVCVLAGAGTGKTRTITHRIAYLVRSGHVEPGQVLAVTFTSRAAGELRARLEALGVYGAQARTFHAAALRQLRYFWPRAVGDSHWQLLESKSRVIGRAAHRAGLEADGDTLRDLAAEIEWAKSSLLGAADYPRAAGRFRRSPPVPAPDVARVYRLYEDLKNSARTLDFADLLLHTVAVLEEHSAVAEEFRNRYRCFVVDEYQDVTPLQQRLLDAWLGNRDDLTVVGDANQTIYSFAGASAQPLLSFTKRFPEAEIVRLERDYRSSPQIVRFANTVIDAARSRPAGSRLRLRGQRADGPEPDFGEYDDEAAEAAAVAERIVELRREGIAAGEMAVLFRVNAQSESYEEALAARGISYVVRGGERFFERAEVRQAMATLRTLASTGTDNDGDLVNTVREGLRGLGLTETPPDSGTARQRWDALDALVRLARQFAASAPDASAASLRRYVTELEERAAAQHPPAVDGVTLASLHAAKGLEWDAVFLVGLADGTLPVQQACDSFEAVEEERRLFYVGVTRAREHLSLSWAFARSPGGRARRRSRFLHGLVPGDAPADRPGAQRVGRADGTRCRVCGNTVTATTDVKLGRCADCPVDLDEDLLARLRRWRTRRAGELRIPTYAVFTDVTLQAIAEQRPEDDRSLVAVSGVGATKLARFGAEVLAVVRGERDG